MNKILPKDLKEAEQAYTSILTNQITEFNSNRIAINLKFEGLKLMPLALRLTNNLLVNKIEPLLLWSDPGSAALAKRDNNELKDYIYVFKDIITNKVNPKGKEILIAVAPQHYDYNEFKEVCDLYNGIILMINGKLEDTSVGIGSVGRDRRKDFILSWEYIYSLEPFSKGALMKSYPDNWTLFNLTKDGYKYLETFDRRPDQSLIIESLMNS